MKKILLFLFFFLFCCSIAFSQSQITGLPAQGENGCNASQNFDSSTNTFTYSIPARNTCVAILPVIDAKSYKNSNPSTKVKILVQGILQNALNQSLSFDESIDEISVEGGQILAVEKDLGFFQNIVLSNGGKISSLGKWLGCTGCDGTSAGKIILPKELRFSGNGNIIESSGGAATEGSRGHDEGEQCGGNAAPGGRGGNGGNAGSIESSSLIALEPDSSLSVKSVGGTGGKGGSGGTNTCAGSAPDGGDGGIGGSSSFISIKKTENLNSARISLASLGGDGGAGGAGGHDAGSGHDDGHRGLNGSDGKKGNISAENLSGYAPFRVDANSFSLSTASFEGIYFVASSSYALEGTLNITTCNAETSSAEQVSVSAKVMDLNVFSPLDFLDRIDYSPLKLLLKKNDSCTQSSSVPMNLPFRGYIRDASNNPIASGTIAVKIFDPNNLSETAVLCSKQENFSNGFVLTSIDCILMLNYKYTAKVAVQSGASQKEYSFDFFTWDEKLKK